MEKDKQIFSMLGFALVICRNKEGKYLGVKESKNRGWWVPGGKVDPPEDFMKAAIRETKEEAGIDIELKGILRVEYHIQSHREMSQRIKVIFYAEPKNEAQKPKNVPDKESDEAQWLTLQEIKDLKSMEPGWRGPELYEWARYLDKGGVIYPMSMFALEGTDVGKESNDVPLPAEKLSAKATTEKPKKKGFFAKLFS